MTRLEPETSDMADLLDIAQRLRSEVLGPAELQLDTVDATEETDSVSGETMNRLLEMGWLDMSTPDSMGGGGADISLSYALAEELADGAPAFASLILFNDVTISAVADTLATSGSDQASAAFGERLADGPIVAVAATSASSDTDILLPQSGLSLTLSPTRQRGPTPLDRAPDTNFILDSGCLPNLPRAMHAKSLLVFVVEPGRMPLYLLPMDGPGLATSRVTTSGLRAIGHGDIEIGELELGADHLLSPDSAEILEAVLTRVNTGTGAIAAGIARQAHRSALEYCKERIQGQKPIVEHDSVAETLWKVETSILALHDMTRASARLISNGATDLRAALRVRAAVTETLVPGVLELLALLGAYGISNEYPLAKIYRDAITLAVDAVLLVGEGLAAGAMLP